MINKTSAFLCLTLFSSVAAAQTAGSSNQPDGWRLQPEFSVGAGYGLTTLKDEDFNEDEAAKKAFALVKLNEYIGIEAAYIDFDKARNDIATFDATGKTLALILEAPLTEWFSVYAKGGQLWWDADASLNSNLVDISDSSDGNETFWGLGTKFRLTNNLDLRVEYERFNFEISRDEVDVLQSSDIDMDIDYASINLQFTF